MEYKLKITPRDYQNAIFETCKEKSCLVVLPTGTGKTLVALMLAVDRFKKFPLKKIVFLAPTRPLVEQHLNYFQKNLPEGFADLQLFTGKTEAPQRRKIWQTAEFIFSTPQCISNDVKRGLYGLEDVALLIVDECHRCLKNYAYNLLSQKYKEQSENPLVLGLTASPGGNMEIIKKVCDNLGIEAVEIRTRESSDVRPYLQELEFEKIDIDFPIEFEEIRQLIREIYSDKLDELKNRKLIFGPANKFTLLQCQQKIFATLESGNKDGNLLMGASICSQAIKIQHSLELLETQTLSSFVSYLKNLYKQAEEKKSKGVQRLVADKRFAKAFTLATTIDFEHPKLNKIKELVKLKMEESAKSKIIIFAQFRETVKKISDELNKMPGVRAEVFVGQAMKEHDGGKSFTGLNQKQQKELVVKFSSGEINVLCATSIAEEGLDIPEVNEVIFYEPVPSAIRKIQRAGRTARLIPGALKILVTRNTRDQASHFASGAREKKMHSVLNDIKSSLDSGMSMGEIGKEKDKQGKLF